MAQNRLQAVVVGSGIAGLATAVAMQDLFDVSIVDPGGLEGGAMGGHHHVTLWGNGCAALESLGVKTSRLGTPIERFEHWTSAGELIWQLDTSQLPGGRARTRQVRLTELRDAVRKLLKKRRAPKRGKAWPRAHEGDYKGYFDRFFDDGERVRVWASDEAGGAPEVELMADLLVGAAGKKDPVRAQLLDDDPIRDLGQTLFVGWLSGRKKAAGALEASWWSSPDPKAPTRVVGFVGEKAWVDIASVRGGFFWIAAVAGSGRTVGDLVEEMTGFPDAIGELVKESEWALKAEGKLGSKRNADKLGWPMTDVMLPGRSTRGGVGLLGDSVHGVTLVLGQSVGLALEDAAVLRDALNERIEPGHDGVPALARPTVVGQRALAREALAEYGRRRRARPALVNSISHVLPQIALSAHLPADVRNAIDRAAMPAMTRLVAETLYRFDPKRPM